MARGTCGWLSPSNLRRRSTTSRRTCSAWGYRASSLRMPPKLLISVSVLGSLGDFRDNATARSRNWRASPILPCACRTRPRLLTASGISSWLEAGFFSKTARVAAPRAVDGGGALGYPPLDFDDSSLQPASMPAGPYGTVGDPHYSLVVVPGPSHF